MGQPLLKDDGVFLGDETNSLAKGQQATGKLYSFELNKRLGTLGITAEEYKRRVRILLSGYKLGITTPEDIDTLLSRASPEILDILESTWVIVDNQFDGWRAYDGYTTRKLQKFVTENI